MKYDNQYIITTTFRFNIFAKDKEEAIQKFKQHIGERNYSEIMIILVEKL